MHSSPSVTDKSHKPSSATVPALQGEAPHHTHCYQFYRCTRCQILPSPSTPQSDHSPGSAGDGGCTGNTAPPAEGTSACSSGVTILEEMRVQTHKTFYSKIRNKKGGEKRSLFSFFEELLLHLLCFIIPESSTNPERILITLQASLANNL